MPNIIKPKRSSVVGKIPTTSDIEVGEIALNMADSILYFRNTSDEIKSISGGSSDSNLDCGNSTEEYSVSDLSFDCGGSV